MQRTTVLCKLKHLALAASLCWMAAAHATDVTTESAPADGWAGASGSTSGGAAAVSSRIYLVSSPSQLLAAIRAAGSYPKIIKVAGTIDMTAADNGGPFTSETDQNTRNRITLKSNTTLIGLGHDATLLNAAVLIKKIDNVIVRNLNIVNPCDIAPVWDPTDGASGNWNSQYDGIVIDQSTHVWIDHNSFTDAPQTDDLAPIENGKLKQCHDGALDIKNAADFVTVSYNVFDQHDKNNLVGSSDSTTTDDGHLRVTFHHNLFSRIVQRAPRVRFGMVHVYNNYYAGDTSDPVYGHEYSLGVGYMAKIISENNAFDIVGVSSCAKIALNPGSYSRPGAITDAGSLLNGAPLALATACALQANVGWSVPYPYVLTPADAVKDAVQGAAGAGKLAL